MVDNSKQLWVFAGPNGSGKSTLIDNYIRLGQCPSNLICPDNFVRPEDRNDKSAFIAAAQKAELFRMHELVMGNSFSFETVLSKDDKIQFIRLAKSKGYFVHVVYISTEDPAINIERVKKRVGQGGHDVPVDKIISRYNRCMELMYDVICEADKADIYDNSDDGRKPSLFVKKRGSTYYVRTGVPTWIMLYLVATVARDNENLVLVSEDFKYGIKT
ncbi:MAG: zeta toxin family protein [Defluviitaleaceae bacterium]|nr:zeta toxin family protein [Defluviitaleaceae bacterium]